MQQSATGDYYADNGRSAPERYKYIGIDKKIAKLPRVRFLQGDHRIDDELELFTIKNRTHSLPLTNKRILVRKGDHFQRDEFEHEQFLVVRQKQIPSDDLPMHTASAGEPLREVTILMSGCAHSGILSIMDAFCERYGKAPDLVISGFHLMKKKEYREEEILEIKEIARELTAYPTKFVTCHCTGMPAFDMMKEIMGDQLEYVHSGEEIVVF
jgi:7,8-dihydropterin-6-yl-methyl-4-(beta-D-ribofuranosyl)aminobenzene 5'-phosphate synthase